MQEVQPADLHVMAWQDTKREAKEMTRQNALLGLTQSHTDRPAMEKEKQVAVNMLMDLAKDKSPTQKAIKVAKRKSTKLNTITKELLKTKQKRVKKTKTYKTHSKQEPRTDIKVKPKEGVRAKVTIHVSGCRHGNLDAMKCMTKAEASHYIRPNKFLENRGCLDCQKKVVDMQPAASNLRSVLYYCDQGIKGYDAPDNDDMKSELTCNLVLCAHCEAVRRIAFDKSSGGRRRKRGQI